jgi:hypothetical protein
MLLNDFEQGLLEGDVIINNGHIPGSTERAGFRLNADGTIDEVHCYLAGRFDFQTMKRRDGNYRGSDGYHADLRAKAAFMFFGAGNNRLISIGDNYVDWVQAVLHTLQAPEELWGAIRSLKTTDNIQRNRFYKETVKPVREEMAEAQAKGPKAAAIVAAQIAVSLNDLVIKVTDGTEITGAQLYAPMGKVVMRNSNWSIAHGFRLDDPAIVQQLQNEMLSGRLLDEFYVNRSAK